MIHVIHRAEPALAKPSPLDTFLAAAPWAENGTTHVREQIRARSYPRKEIAELLRTYNQRIRNNDTAATHSLEAFAKEDSVCVITGQQVGFMGGPLYTILKGVTCLQVAREHNAVPLFWLASEDHDLHEINHAYQLDGKGNLHSFPIPFPTRHTFVEDIPFTASQKNALLSFLEPLKLGGSDWDFINESFGSYTSVMAQMMAKIFAGTGMVFLEPRILRPFAGPFFQKELKDAESIFNTIQQTTERLILAGGEAQLQLAEGTNLFLKTPELHRSKIRYNKGIFTVNAKQMTLKELLSAAEVHPDRFSTNAAARTVLQSNLLPTLAYIAGPSELNYYRQLKDYHALHSVPMPWIIPRSSATIVPSWAAELLHKCGLEAWDPIPAQWTPSKDKEERLLLREMLSQKGIPYHALHMLRNLLHPKDTLQERVLNWWFFQANLSENLLQELLHLLNFRFQGHHYILLVAEKWELGRRQSPGAFALAQIPVFNYEEYISCV